MKNKRGAELSINTIILIVLGVLVLAFIIFGFIVGWGNFSNLFVKDNNIKSLKDSCGLACSTQDQFEFCLKDRTLKEDKQTETEKINCFWLGKKKSLLGFTTCNDIDCGKAGLYDTEVLAKAECKTDGEKINYLGDNAILEHVCVIKPAP